MRENGGQYTPRGHLGGGWHSPPRSGRKRPWRTFSMLNPVSHALSQEDAEHYRVEPYVVAADIYGEGALAGRGGWTW